MTPTSFPKRGKSDKPRNVDYIERAKFSPDNQSARSFQPDEVEIPENGLMCGIVGFTGQTSFADLEAMNLAQKHRGPDDHGYLEDSGGHVSLGMTRLSIQDDQGGRQPMSADAGNLTVVFNGEIFNAPEIRRDLEGEGFSFTSHHSDTEVLLHLYKRDGKEMVKKLTGMFAFTIFDRSNRRLFGARDQAGIKPFYFSLSGGRFSFASELKSLLNAPWIERQLDRQAIFDYFTFQCVPSPRTPFAKIQKLPPANYFEYDLEEAKLTLSAYWEPNFLSTDLKGTDINDVGIRDSLLSATERWMTADVPVGISLSGGIDSSILVALASSFGQQVQTFSLGFPDSPEIDESDLARGTARKWKTDHHQIILRDKDLISNLSQMVYHLDEPYGGGLPSWFVFKEMSNHVKVAVVGTGGDELFGNYGKWLPYQSIKSAAKITVSNFLTGASLSDWLSNRKAFRYHLYLRDAQKRKLFQPEFLSGLVASEAMIEYLWRGSGLKDARNIVPFIDFKIQLPEEFLHMTDRFSMAHSVEARTPYLDQDFVNLVFSIPSRLRTSKRSLKHLLIEQHRDLLTPAVASAPKKGFVLPYAKWLRGELRAEVERLFSQSFISGQSLFTAAVRRDLVQPFLNGDDRKTARVWTFFMFQLWYEKIVLGQNFQ